MKSNSAIQINLDGRPAFSFSQPAHVEDLLLCTQLQAMQQTQPSQVVSFVKYLLDRYSVLLSRSLFTCIDLLNFACLVAKFPPEISPPNDQILR